MDYRRQLLMFVLMLGLFFLWINLAQRLFPQFFEPQQVKQNPVAVEQADRPIGNADRGAARTDTPAAEEEVDESAEIAFEEAEPRTVLLGDPKQGDLQRLQLTSLGAAIDWQELTEPQYRTLDRKAQVRVLGSVPGTPPSLRTLNLSSPQLDADLSPFAAQLSTSHWAIDEEASEPIANSDAYRRVVFRFDGPGGKWRAVKAYELNPAKEGHLPDDDPSGYLVDVTLQFVNLSTEPLSLSYQLQGPVGMPLENEEHTRIYRKVEAGALKDPADPLDVSLVSMTAAAVAEKYDNQERPSWRDPIRWAGVNNQYFAALMIPAESQLKSGYFEEILPTRVTIADEAEKTHVSLVFKSQTLTVPPGEQAAVSHGYQLYLGPKRPQLLEDFQATDIMDFGWFGGISKGMVWLLNFFHHWLKMPYWLAIIALTVIVRGCMFPLSKKQVANVQKMKEINPKLQELKTKYANDKEALTRAQLELMRKHGYNPFSGCLPIFLQMPIFIGLYNGLNTAIDLRLATFLWADSLATPDQLFEFPFRVPFLGNEFNLLPIITVVLFVIQQKLFTPPPTNEEQALQQKMMNFMMIFIGVLFYHVPAGLCVYFIASSLWGIAERKLLDRHKLALEASGALTVTKRSDEDAGPRPPGFLAKLLEAADQAKNASAGKSPRPPGPERERKKNRSKPRR